MSGSSRAARKVLRGATVRWLSSLFPSHFSRSVLLLAIGANGTGLVERCYGSVTLRTPTPEGTPCIRLSAHRYRIVTETTPSVKMEGSAELWHVLPLAMGGVRAGP